MKVIKAKIKNYINTENFKFIIGIMFIYSIYNIMYSTATYSYIGSILYVYTDVLTVLFIVALFLINTINTIKLFDKNTSYIIRYKTKKSYFKNLIKNIFFNNSVLFIIYFIMQIALLVIFNRNGIVIDTIGSYSISNLTYTIVHLIKTFILIQCFSLICAFMYKIGIKFIVWILLGILIVLSLETPYKEGYIIDSISKINIGWQDMNYAELLVLYAQK